MNGIAKNISGWERRKARVRKRVKGTADRPRLNVYRSNKHIYAQLVDDMASVTLAAASTKSKNLAGAKAKKLDSAKKVGELIAKIAQGKGITKVVFDRNGYLYHGRIKALAEGARAAGLNF